MEENNSSPKESPSAIWSAIAVILLSILIIVAIAAKNDKLPFLNLSPQEPVATTTGS